MLCCALPCCAVLALFLVLRGAVLDCAVLRCAVRCCAVLRCAVRRVINRLSQGESEYEVWTYGSPDADSDSRFRPASRGHRVAAANGETDSYSQSAISRQHLIIAEDTGDGIDVDWRGLTVRRWTAELSVRPENSVSEFRRTALEPAASPVLNVGASQSRKDVALIYYTEVADSWDSCAQLGQCVTAMCASRGRGLVIS